MTTVGRQEAEGMIADLDAVLDAPPLPGDVPHDETLRRVIAGLDQRLAVAADADVDLFLTLVRAAAVERLAALTVTPP